jgi:beta-xylosidase
MTNGTSTFRPGEIWPDNNGVHINVHGGGILYQNGVYYWYGEHKIAGKAGNKAHVGVACYSSTDLYNWKDEGIALPVVKDEPKHDITQGCVLERPKVIYNQTTGKYVMWFHLELKGQGYRAARSGVAVSDFVTGPFTFVESFRPDAGVWPQNVTEDDKIPREENYLVRDFESGQMARDMTLFVDDDGTAYHLFASEENQTLHIAKLTDDYLRPSGEYVRVFAGRSMEAPTIFKREDKYYFIGSGCTGWAPNAARSAVADSVMGPWEELGNPCIGEDQDLTFNSQSTHVLPVEGKPGCFIFMADRWRPDNAIDGRHIWLPIEFEDGRPVLRWQEEWSLSYWDK